MKLQRGIALTAVLSLLGVAALAYAFYWYGQTRYAAGVAAEKASSLAREAKELSAKNDEILKLEGKYRALEAKSALDVSAAGDQYEHDMKEVTNERDAAFASARRNYLERVRLESELAAARKAAGGGATAKACAPQEEPDGAPLCRLSEKGYRAEEDLIRLAADADQVVAERNELSDIAVKDREVCR